LLGKYGSIKNILSRYQKMLEIFGAKAFSDENDDSLLAED